MPIIVDIYYSRGDIIFTGLLEHCEALNTFYDVAWRFWMFEIFVTACCILFMSTYMAKLQANRLAFEIRETDTDDSIKIA